MAQQVIASSAGIISSSTAVSSDALSQMEDTLIAMELGPLLGIFMQSLLLHVAMWIMSIIIFVIIYGRMIETYLMTSLAPIPFATFANREQSQIGQNYFRFICALGFQGFLIMICVGIYAVLIQNIAFSNDIIASVWGVLGYTVLLCFTLFKTGSLANLCSMHTEKGGISLGSLCFGTKRSYPCEAKSAFQSDEKTADLFSVAALIGVPSFF